MRAEEREGAEGAISGGTWESSDKTERRREGRTQTLLLTGKE